MLMIMIMMMLMLMMLVVVVVVMVCCQTVQQQSDEVSRLTAELDSSTSEADLLRTDKVDSVTHCRRR